MSQRTAVFIYLVLGFAFYCSCSPSYLKHLNEYHFQNKTEIPDYSNLDYWAANPNKKSLSDSIPAPLRNSFIKDTSADVFFLHPTTFGSLKDKRWNADINRDSTNAKTDYSTILFQASAFNECQIYAPRYRQANILAYYTKDTVAALRAFDLAYQDLKTAFQYYLDHYNHGRPIIIASHSQGSTHAIRLLKDFFDGKPLQKQLVAAYVVGMYLPQNSFTSLPQCKDSLQTGCFVGWRSFKIGYIADYVAIEKTKSYVNNPLTWTTTEEYADKTLNKGAVVLKFNDIIPHSVDAQIHNGVLWMHKPHFPGSFLFRTKNYHIGDINLFYMNVRENVNTRINQFKLKNQF